MTYMKYILPKLGVAGIFLISGFLIAFLLGLLFGLTALGSLSLGGWAGFASWLKDWQEIVGAVIGSVATVTGASLIMLQINADDDREARRDRQRILTIAGQMMTEAMFVKRQIADIYLIYDKQRRIVEKNHGGTVPASVRDTIQKTLEITSLDITALRAFDYDVRYLGPRITIQYRTVLRLSTDAVFAAKNSHHPSFNLVTLCEAVKQLGTAIGQIIIQCETISHGNGNIAESETLLHDTNESTLVSAKKQWDEALRSSKIS